jgi:hypothetical protein
LARQFTLRIPRGARRLIEYTVAVASALLLSYLIVELRW